MPKSVALFERLSYLSLFLGAISAVLNWATISKFAHQSPLLYPAALLLTFAIQILFIWLIARKRKNWARWIWIFVILGGTALAIFDVNTRVANGITAAIAYYVVYLVSIVATLFLLAPDAWVWFRSPKLGTAT